MKSLIVFVLGERAGLLTEDDGRYTFCYEKSYLGPPVSKTMPVDKGIFYYDRFPAFFDGLLPEGGQLSFLLKSQKIDSYDYMAQLEAVGSDVVGGVTVLAEAP